MNGAIKVTVNQKQKKHSEMTDEDHIRHAPNSLMAEYHILD